MNELFKQLQIVFARLYEATAGQIRRDFAEGEPWAMEEGDSFINLAMLTAAKAKAIREDQNESDKVKSTSSSVIAWHDLYVNRAKRSVANFIRDVFVDY